MAHLSDDSTLHDAAELHELASGFESNVGVYIGMFSDVQYEEGRSMCLHGLRKYQVFAFAQDVVAGSIQSVAFTDAMFQPTRGTTNTRVHGTSAAVD
jgi:hypothetical protein